MTDDFNIDVLIQRLRAANAGGLREQVYQSLCGDAADALSALDAKVSSCVTGEPQSPSSASVPDDLRFKGWSVAVHNDYRVNGVPHTFWLFTKGDRAIKGEAETDEQALNLVREQIFERVAKSSSISRPNQGG